MTIDVILLHKVISIINDKIYNSPYHKNYVEKAVRQLSAKTVKGGKLLLKDAIIVGRRLSNLAESEKKNIYIFNTPNKYSCAILANSEEEALNMIRERIELAYKASPIQYLTGLKEQVREVAIPVGEWINENIQSGLKTVWHKSDQKGSVAVKIMKDDSNIGRIRLAMSQPDIIITFHIDKVQILLSSGKGIKDKINISYADPSILDIIKDKILKTYK